MESGTPDVPSLPEAHIVLLTRNFPEQAERWLNTFRQKCAEKDFDEEPAKVQIARHGWLNYLLLAREYPAVVMVSGSDLTALLRKATEDHNLEWLQQDAFLLFVTDRDGVKLAQDLRLVAVPWFESTQDLLIERLVIFHQTSVMRGFSHITLEIRRQIATYAEKPPEGRVRPPILILGPSRSGKEHVARALHQATGLPDDRFEGVGCGTFNPELLLDQLFGHWEGAFTGANTPAPGALERYTIVFIDDLDAAKDPEGLQAALLRFLSTNPPAVRRLGFPKLPGQRRRSEEWPPCSACWRDNGYSYQGKRYESDCATCKILNEVGPKTVGTWLIFATNKSPQDMIHAQTMREDFFYRFQRIITVPPLCARRSDIPHIATFLWQRDGAQGTRPPDVPVLKWLRDRKSDWPENVGELQKLLDHAHDLIREDRKKTWTQAFEEVARRGEAPWQRWETAAGVATDASDDSTNSLGGSVRLINEANPTANTVEDRLLCPFPSKGRRKQAENLEQEIDRRICGALEKKDSLDKEYQEWLAWLQDLQHILTAREKPNPRPVYYYQFLWYLASFPGEKKTIGDFERRLGLSWQTLKKVAIGVTDFKQILSFGLVPLRQIEQVSEDIMEILQRNEGESLVSEELCTIGKRKVYYYSLRSGFPRDLLS